MGEYAMEVQYCRVAAIRVSQRKRQIDPKVVRDIAKSIEAQGLLQPIGVKDPQEDEEEGLKDEVVDLVFGAHRLAAYQVLGRTEIEALILPSGLTEEEYLLMELQENNARNDLTTAQRKAYAGDIGVLSAKLDELRKSATGRVGWLRHFAEQTNVPLRSMELWWTTFCHETKRTITSKDALDQDRDAFFAWLQEQRAKEHAEKEKREEEARAERQRQDIADALDNLATLAADYGRDLVITEVIEVFLAGT